MRHLVSFFLSASLFVMPACSSTEWVHPYKKKNELVYDYNKCERKVDERQMKAPTVTYTSSVQRGMIDDCLRKEGWVQREVKD